jgi:hypothetical protein
MTRKDRQSAQDLLLMAQLAIAGLTLWHLINRR